MTILPRRSTLIPLSAEVQQIKEAVKADAPNPSDVMGTMAYWDKYRARERARFAAMNLRLDEAGVPLPGQGLASALKIDEFPDFEHPETIPDADEIDRKREQAHAIATAHAVRMARPWYERALDWLLHR